MCNHKADDRTKRATDVQRLHPLCAFNLAITCIACHLLGRIKQHARTGGTYRVAATYQAATHVHWATPTALNGAIIDSLPALAWRGQTQVVKGYILGGRKAVMGFYPADGINA